MLKDELLACCKKLRLSRNLADNSELVEADSREEYLLSLLKLEIGHREKGRRDRLIKAAGFTSWKTFDGFRFDDVKLPSGVTPDYLAKARFVEETKNLILYGNVGTGKTHLATAIGIEACRIGMSTGFIAVNVIAEGVDQRIGHDDVIPQIHLPLRGYPYRRPVGMIAVISAVESGKGAGTGITREAAGNGVIRQQDGKLVETARIQFLR